MKAIAFLLLLTLTSPAQVLGAYTTFSNEESATTWGVVDFGDPSSAFAPSWTYPGSDDAEIYTTFESTQDPDTGRSEVFEVSLFADQLSSEASFVGDYDEVGIDTVRCDVFVEDIHNFQELEVYFLSGDTFYYSEVFELNESGWAQIETSFSKDEWYLFDDEERAFFPVEMTPMILSDVREIGITFYPRGPGAQGRVIAIDNFSLLPDLTVPALSIDTSRTNPRLSFTGIPGIQYTLQRSLALREDSWANLGDPFEVTGPFQRPVAAGRRRFFRLISQPLFVEIP
jgi:hypothetical protein